MATTFTHTCACCGKEFYTTSCSNWLYKRTIKGRVKWYCSYTCYKKAVDKK